MASGHMANLVRYCPACMRLGSFGSAVCRFSEMDFAVIRVVSCLRIPEEVVRYSNIVHNTASVLHPLEHVDHLWLKLVMDAETHAEIPSELFDIFTFDRWHDLTPPLLAHTVSIPPINPCVRLCLLNHEHPVVLPHVSHLRHVPFRTSVKFMHSEHISPS